MRLRLAASAVAHEVSSAHVTTPRGSQWGVLLPVHSWALTTWSRRKFWAGNEGAAAPTLDWGARRGSQVALKASAGWVRDAAMLSQQEGVDEHPTTWWPPASSLSCPLSEAQVRGVHLAEVRSLLAGWGATATGPLVVSFPGGRNHQAETSPFTKIAHTGRGCSRLWGHSEVGTILLDHQKGTGIQVRCVAGALQRVFSKLVAAKLPTQI